MKKIVLLASVLVLLSTALALCVVGLLELRIAYASPYTDISVDTAYNMITNSSYPDLVVLDVRTKSEYDTGHIYGAVWIPQTELEARIGELAGHENHEIIVYCLSGGRSLTASGILDSHNFTKVYNMVGGISAWQSAGYPVWIATVHNINTTFNYDTIQAAIDAPQTLYGHIIFVEAGTYYENVVVNKSLSLVGENRSTTIIDGNLTGHVIEVTANNIKITGFTIRKSGCGCAAKSGVYVESYNQNVNITNNLIIQNGYGIKLDQGQNITLSSNNITNNAYDGIYLSWSFNNTIFGNNITNNRYGIWLQQCWNNSISGNYIANRDIGICVPDSSEYNSIYENSIANNEWGISLAYSSKHNSIYHNNFVNNFLQAITYYDSTNVWDDGYPSGGNYWSDYTGVDANMDGIGDSSYELDSSNIDYYPLMGIYSNFSISLDDETYHLTTVCNSTISEFQFNDIAKTISFNVAGQDYTLGFCRLTLPNNIVQDLWQGNYTVLVDGKEPITMHDWTDETYTYIYFTYLHSEHKVEIIPEFPTWVSMLLILFVLTVVVAIYKRRLLKTPIH